VPFSAPFFPKYDKRSVGLPIPGTYAAFNSIAFTNSLFCPQFTGGLDDVPPILQFQLHHGIIQLASLWKTTKP